LPDDLWARIEPRLVFVWDTMNVESLRAVLAEWDGLPEHDRLDNNQRSGETNDHGTACATRSERTNDHE